MQIFNLTLTGLVETNITLTLVGLRHNSYEERKVSNEKINLSTVCYHVGLLIVHAGYTIYRS